MQPEQKTPGNTGTSPSVDLNWLRECTDGDDLAIKMMIDLYLSRTPPLLAELERAVAGNAAADVARIAHACAGSSGACGMTNMVPLFRQLETNAKAGNLANSAVLAEATRAEFDRIKEFLRVNLSIG